MAPTRVLATHLCEGDAKAAVRGLDAQIAANQAHFQEGGGRVRSVGVDVLLPNLPLTREALNVRRLTD